MQKTLELPSDCFGDSNLEKEKFNFKPRHVQDRALRRNVNSLLIRVKPIFSPFSCPPPRHRRGRRIRSPGPFVQLTCDTISRPFSPANARTIASRRLSNNKKNKKIPAFAVSLPSMPRSFHGVKKYEPQ